MRFIILPCTLWFGLMAGFFFSYSATVMPGLELLAPSRGMGAMQSINAAVANPFFASGFWVALGLAIVGLGYAVIKREDGWEYLFAGCALYILGSFVVTGAGNVPMNRALEVLPPTGEANLLEWSIYLRDWTSLNHVRMGASFFAAAIVLAPLLRPIPNQEGS